MRRFRFLGLALSCLLAAGVVPDVRAQEKMPDDEEALRLRRVIMFTAGVAFYEHNGTVDGDAKVDIKFRTENINDLLKSMVVQDGGGGRISTATYPSREPIERLLGTFAIDLNGNPTLGDILNQVRGERVEIESPAKITGIILGVETKTRVVDEETVEKQYLNLLTDEGLRSIAMESVNRIKLLDAELNKELMQALTVLATQHSTDKKTVSLNFLGEGERNVRVGYIQESPIWKTSYRLVVGEDAPLLQGWAIVENTTEADWQNVQLTLVSGRPISFRMDLYEPLFMPRPLVEPELYASLRPPAYEDDLLDRRDNRREMADFKAKESAEESRAAMPAAPPGLAYAGRGAAQSADATKSEEKLNLSEGFASMAQAGDLGDLFQYVIESPVTLPRRQSAMIPIVNKSVEADKLSIYNVSVQPKHPLRGLRLKNTSGTHLMQGPITVFDDGAYAGDARIMDLPPSAERLISYALNLDVEVAREQKSAPDQITEIKIVRGTLSVSRKYEQTTEYTVKNSGKKKETVLIEHPINGGWELLKPTEPTERTRDMYRFSVDVEPGESTKLAVVEQRVLVNGYALTNLDDNTIIMYSSRPQASPELTKALQEVVKRKAVIAELVAERSRQEQLIRAVEQEQSRIRENMTRIPRESDLYARYIAKFTEQEDQVEDARAKINELQKKEQELRQELNNYLQNLTIG
jgi:hypothetical protein